MINRIVAVRIYNLGRYEMMDVLNSNGSVTRSAYDKAIFNDANSNTAIYDEREKPEWDKYCRFYVHE